MIKHYHMNFYSTYRGLHMFSLYSSNWEMTIQTMDLLSRYYDLYIIHTCLLPQLGNPKSNNQFRKNLRFGCPYKVTE